MILSKLERKDLMHRAVRQSQRSLRGGKPEQYRTIFLVLGLLLAVLAAQLGPLRAVILRRGVGRLTVQSDDLLAQLHTCGNLLRLRRRQFGVEEP